MEYELIKDETHDAGAFMSYARGRVSARQERDPDVGDTVHFWDMVDAKCYAATVADVGGGAWAEPVADLAVLSITAEGKAQWGARTSVAHDETKTGPSWHWPCGGH